MNREAYRYSFPDLISLTDVQDTIFLAIFSAEGLHGRAQVRLDVGYCLDEAKHSLIVDAGTPAGKTVAQIFTGLLSRQLGEDAFVVEHVFGNIGTEQAGAAP